MRPNSLQNISCSLVDGLLSCRHNMQFANQSKEPRYCCDASPTYQMLIGEASMFDKHLLFDLCNAPKLRCQASTLQLHHILKALFVNRKRRCRHLVHGTGTTQNNATRRVQTQLPPLTPIPRSDDQSTTQPINQSTNQPTNQSMWYVCGVLQQGRKRITQVTGGRELPVY
jgi:hypothetical protein